MPIAGDGILGPPGHSVANCIPDIDAGVRTPWPPGFGPFLQLRGSPQIEGAEEPPIAGWKRVRFSEGAHGYVLGGPTTDARNFTDLGQEGIRVYNAFEADLLLANRACEGTNRLGTLLRQAKTDQVTRIGISNDFGRRKQMREIVARGQPVAEVRGEAPCQSGCRFHRDQGASSASAMARGASEASLTVFRSCTVGRRWRSIINASLMAIRVTHVPNVESSRNLARFMNAR